MEKVGGYEKLGSVLTHTNEFPADWLLIGCRDSLVNVLSRS